MYHQLDEENKMAVDRALYAAREAMKKEMLVESIKQLDERLTKIELWLLTQTQDD